MISNLLDNPAVLRIGWAWIHFIWQAVLVALALKCVLMLIDQRFSRIRYALSLGSLLLMATLPVLLLCKPERRNPEAPAVYDNVQLEPVVGAGFTSTAFPIHRNLDSNAGVTRWAAPWIPWIAAGWFLGMALLLLKTLGGIVQVRRLKKKAAEHDKTKEIASFLELAARAKVAGVSIVESRHISIPTVAGWIRPVILLPDGVLERIDPPMLDALVAHELAHIRRRDSVVNLLQILIEDWLFFHPAMWWVSRSVRAEREACCDDDAVALCGDPLVYVRALSRAEQFRSSIMVVALGSSPLLHRIRRLTEMRISKMNRSIAFCISFFAASFIFATAAGSFVLATIPAQNVRSGVSAKTGSGNQDIDKAKMESQAPQLRKEIKYALLCGIIGGRRDKADGQPIPPPPPPKDEKGRVGQCLLLDISTPKASLVSGEFEASRLIHRVDPVYPESAIRGHVGIRVVVHMSINEEGLVTDAEVMQSQTVPPDRDSKGNWVGGVRASVIKSVTNAAINAVRQWKYSPTLLNGQAIPVGASASIAFTFNKDGAPVITAYAP